MIPRSILLRVWIREIIPVLGVDMSVEFGIAVGYVGTLLRGVGVDFTADDSCAARHFFFLFGVSGFDFWLIMLIWLIMPIWLVMLMWLVMLI